VRKSSEERKLYDEVVAKSIYVFVTKGTLRNVKKQGPMKCVMVISSG
jgi:hypothetical protein